VHYSLGIMLKILKAQCLQDIELFFALAFILFQILYWINTKTPLFPLKKSFFALKKP
jgi:hypothetical protein